jgi:HSP20 family molecular chaperone IbpA
VRKEDTEKGCYRSEFRNGLFERVLPLPAGATDTGVHAT